VPVHTVERVAVVALIVILFNGVKGSKMLICGDGVRTPRLRSARFASLAVCARFCLGGRSGEGAVCAVGGTTTGSYT
jgi:hypothetical protein